MKVKISILKRKLNSVYQTESLYQEVDSQFIDFRCLLTSVENHHPRILSQEVDNPNADFNYCRLQREIGVPDLRAREKSANQMLTSVFGL